MSEPKKLSLHEIVTNRIIDALESGAVPWTRPWRNSAPCNAVTKRNYRGINTLMLWLAAQERGYECNGWMTYLQAKTMGGQVRHGEKATGVIWWKPVNGSSSDEAEPEESTHRFWFARTYWVFNVDQVDGIEDVRKSLDSPILEFTPLYRCEKLVETYGADVRHGGEQAYYSRQGDYIQLPPPSSFESREAYYSVLMHEITHSTGAAHRLNRDLTGRFGSDSYAREELVGELGSAFLTAQLGIPHQTRANASYIASWLKVLRGDKRAIFEASKLAQQACDYISPPPSEVESAA
jgi:antirestriction protein ArdC